MRLVVFLKRRSTSRITTANSIVSILMRKMAFGGFTESLAVTLSQNWPLRLPRLERNGILIIGHRLLVMLDMLCQSFWGGRGNIQMQSFKGINVADRIHLSGGERATNTGMVGEAPQITS